MKKIDRLTSEQDEALAAYREQWLAHGRSTEPADRPATEAALRSMYVALGEREPYIWWCSGPASGSLVRTILLKNLRDTPWENLLANRRVDLWANLEKNLGADLGESLGKNMQDNLRKTLWANLQVGLQANLQANLWANLEENLWANLQANLRANLQDNLWASLQANLWANLQDNQRENLQANLWANLRENLRENMRANMRANMRVNLRANMRENMRANLRENLGENLQDNLGASPGTNLRASLRANLQDNLWANLQDNMWENMQDDQRENLWANLQANLWANLQDNLGANLWANLGTNLRANLGTNLRENLRENLRVNLRENLRVNLRDTLGTNLRENLGASLGASLGTNLRANLGANLNWGYRGQHEGYWPAFYAWPDAALRPMHTQEQRVRLGWWLTLARGCGWWHPYRGIVFVCERPERQAVDTLGRLHHETGPALLCRDGWPVYAWHGVRVPREVIEAPETLEPRKAIAETNVEVRRVMLHRIGAERLERALPSKTLHEDTDGRGQHRRLFDLQGVAGVRYIAYTCPSTGRVYPAQPVPPQVRTCAEAVAWRFGALDVGDNGGLTKRFDYAPALEG